MEELKERLNNNLGQTWDTLHGTFELTKETIEWIVVNAKTSMYNELRSYVYNKAFFEKFLNKTKSNIEKVKKSVEEGFVLHKQLTNNADRFKLIREWAKERGLYAKGDTKTQFCKLMEEAGELGRAILKDDKPEFVDAIGDMIVVLTNLAHLGGFSIEHCIDSAYDEIKNRKGNMKNGTFVKS
jgi:NTP pyrophosphatase (non-canonical NTP hydrolase)